ncbi:MAG: DUF6339 family protein [Candidatus Omnitrophota bacterium]
MAQRIFKRTYIDELKLRLSKNDIDQGYLKDGVKFNATDTMINPLLQSPTESQLTLMMPDEGDDFQFNNSKSLYEHFKNMNITQATDARIWTYLTHVTFWKYMSRFRPIGKQPEDKRKNYIRRHYFLDPVNAKNLVLNDISLLWWGAHLSHDEQNKEDPYWLTKEFFSMLDYTRHLLPSVQGRNKTFVRAVLNFVVDHEEIFSEAKEAKVRFVMRKCNFIAGYKVFPILTRQEIMNIMGKYIDEIKRIVPGNIAEQSEEGD